MSLSGSRVSRKHIPREELVGRALHKGAYVVEAVLGHGGMGQVYLASHVQVDVPVALKQVRADEPLPPAVIEELDRLLREKNTPARPAGGDFPLSGGANTDRFLREALLLARLRHPAIPLLYDYFLEDGQWYLVMEYIPGPTLAAYMREHAPLPALEAINYALQVCDVLDYLHRQSPPVIFRDLKPSNIILHPDGRLMMVDFGIARYFKEGQFNDTTDFGSPGYASPEQYEGSGQTDARSDLFSLGVILHEMLSGQRPTRRGVERDQLESLNRLNPAISPALSGLVMVATRAEPMYRFQSAHTFYQALERVRAVEERRAYRYHALMAEVTAAQKTPVFPMLIPPPSSQGFLSSSLAREQDQRSQHMRMREQTPRTVPRAGLAQEALAHQLTSIDENLKLRTLSAPLTRSAVHPVSAPAANHTVPAVKVEHSPAPVAAPAPSPLPVSSPRPAHPVLSLTPHAPTSSPRKRRHRKGWVFLILFVMLLLLSCALLVYSYFFIGKMNLPHMPPPFFESSRMVTPTTPATPTVEMPAAATWQNLPALPDPAADNTALYVADRGQGVIYMTGGYRGAVNPAYSRGLYRYDIATARWSKLALPGLPAMGNNAAAQDEQGDLFFTGGYAPVTGTVSTNLYLYQPATDTLRVLYVPPQLPLGFGSSLLADRQGHLYLTEGFLTPGSPYALAGTGWYRYDIATGLWHNLTSLPVGLGYVQLGMDASGNILLLGGARDAGQRTPSTQIYRYDPVQNAWYLMPATTPPNINGAASCADGHGNLIIVGGYNATLNRSFSTTWLFNLQTFRWQQLAPLPGGGSVLGTAVCDGRGHVYVTRGADNPTRPTADFLELTLPNMESRR